MTAELRELYNDMILEHAPLSVRPGSPTARSCCVFAPGLCAP